MSSEWLNKLKDMPFSSRKKGKFAKLLKAKCEETVKRNPPKTYEAFDFMSLPKEKPEIKADKSMPSNQEKSFIQEPRAIKKIQPVMF